MFSKYIQSGKHTERSKRDKTRQKDARSGGVKHGLGTRFTNWFERKTESGNNSRALSRGNTELPHDVGNHTESKSVRPVTRSQTRSIVQAPESPQQNP